MMKLLVQQMSTSEKAAEEYMAGLYRNLVMDPFSRQQYRKFFGILLDQKEGAVLWHCSAGKDRVGVGTALLLSALGVPRETILADYMMVNTFTAEVVESRLEELNERLQNPQPGSYTHLDGYKRQAPHIKSTTWTSPKNQPSGLGH